MSSHATILQLEPTIPVVTPDGKGEALGWIDYGKDDDLMWIVFLQKNGECWIYPNPKIRAVPNLSFGRMPGVSTEEVIQSIRKSRPDGKKQRLRSTPSFARNGRKAKN